MKFPLKLTKLLILTALLPVSCGTLVGPEPVLQADGPIPRKSSQPDDLNPFVRFRNSWAQAMQTSNVAADNKALLRSGITIVYNNCTDFFRTEGKLQQRLAFAKDLTGAIVPIATGALGLVSGAGVAVAAIGLGGSSATTGINVVNQSFLFGSDNIDDVETLTRNSLGAHENTVIAVFELNPVNANFDWVSQQILDHQVLCEPQKIYSLVKQSIAKANVCPYTTLSSGGSEDKPVKQTGSAAPTTGLPARVGVRVQPSCDATTPKLPASG